MSVDRISLTFPKMESKSLKEQGEKFYLENCRASNRYNVTDEFMGYSIKNKVQVYHTFDTLHAEDERGFGEYFCHKKDLSNVEGFKVFEKVFSNFDCGLNPTYRRILVGFDFFININRFEKRDEKYNLYFRQKGFLKDGFNIIFYEDSKRENNDHQEHWVEINEYSKVIYPRKIQKILDFFNRRSVNKSLLDKLENSIVILREKNPERREHERKII